jgi:hypothetical protein
MATRDRFMRAKRNKIPSYRAKDAQVEDCSASIAGIQYKPTQTDIGVTTNERGRVACPAAVQDITSPQTTILLPCTTCLVLRYCMHLSERRDDAGKRNKADRHHLHADWIGQRDRFVRPVRDNRGPAEFYATACSGGRRGGFGKPK